MAGISVVFQFWRTEHDQIERDGFEQRGDDLADRFGHDARLSNPTRPSGPAETASQALDLGTDIGYTWSEFAAGSWVTPTDSVTALVRRSVV